MRKNTAKSAIRAACTRDETLCAARTVSNQKTLKQHRDLFLGLGGINEHAGAAWRLQKLSPSIAGKASMGTVSLK